MRTDPLAGLSRAARRDREQADLDLLVHHPYSRSANPDDLALVKRETGQDISAIPVAVVLRRRSQGGSKNRRPGRAFHPEFTVCMRFDLDHPTRLPDNQFGNCADCGCPIQFRPKLPSVPKICICCAARRVRECAGDP